MINNYKCENCDHFTICKRNDKLAPFHKDAKKDLGIAITMDDCVKYEEVKDK